MYATANGRIGVQVQPLQNNYSLVKLSDRVALITKALKRPGKGGRLARVQAGYFGFSDREAANKFAATINERFGIDCFVRKPERLADVTLEVKVRAFDGLEQLAWEKAVKQPQPPSLVGLRVEVMSPEIHDEERECRYRDTAIVNVSIPSSLLPIRAGTDFDAKLPALTEAVQNLDGYADWEILSVLADGYDCDW